MRFGAGRMVSAGLALTGISAAIGLMGLDVAHFWVTLVLLGLGWNFGFVGASALVLECHRPEERTKVQSLNDFIIFGIMAVGSFASGGLLAARLAHGAVGLVHSAGAGGHRAGQERRVRGVRRDAMLRLSPQKIPPGRLTCLMAAALCAVPVLAAERVDIPGYEARAGAQYRYRVQKTTETDMSSWPARRSPRRWSCAGISCCRRPC